MNNNYYSDEYLFRLKTSTWLTDPGDENIPGVPFSGMIYI